MSTRAFLCIALLWASSARAASPVDGADQLLVVVTESWEATDGQLFRVERKQKQLRVVGTPIHVVIGSAGLGWGRGPYPFSFEEFGGPVKEEGDRRSPAGVFALDRVTGDDEAPPGTTLTYLRATDDLRCVDDPDSPRYNELVRAPPHARSWKSDEAMHRSDGIYRLTIVVEQNPPPVQAGAGSCVFLHAYDQTHSPTVGCTSLSYPDLARLVSFLRAPAHPQLVQLPRPIYRRLRKRWHLPILPSE